MKFDTIKGSSLPALDDLNTAEGGEQVAKKFDAALLEHGAVGAIARPLFTDYLVPFELTGILLLVAIVGAIALAKKSF